LLAACTPLAGTGSRSAITTTATRPDVAGRNDRTDITFSLPLCVEDLPCRMLRHLDDRDLSAPATASRAT
jgi:hypothetical protein